jgi:hypothetical protein
MSSFNQYRDASADGIEGGLDLGLENDRSGQVDEPVPPAVPVSPALLGEAMIERAKTVVIVARRVDEDQAAQILLEAADKAHIPVRVAADQVMTALEEGVEPSGGITQDMLVQALDCVRPVERDPSSTQVSAQITNPVTSPVSSQVTTSPVSSPVSSQVSEVGSDQSKPLPTGPPAHQAA